MSDSNNNATLSELFQDAMRTQDWTKFNNDLKNRFPIDADDFGQQVSSFTETVVKEATSQIERTAKEHAQRAEQTAKEHAERTKRVVREQTSSFRTAKRYTYTGRQESKPYPPSLICRSPKGTASSVLRTIFGCTLYTAGVTFGFLAFVSPFFLIGTAATFALGTYECSKAGNTRKRISRFRTYCHTLQGKTYCALSDLSAAVNKKASYVASDLQRMIGDGLFPQGHVSADQTMFLLSDDIYRQYIDAIEKQRKLKALEGDKPQLTKEFQETYELGMQYKEKLRLANDAIPGEEISKKLYQLEAVIEKIFEHVKNHPDQLSELRRFMDYYLPTTIKLVETYRDLQLHQTTGPNVQNTMKEIETSLDTIIVAFNSLFDRLFASTAVDVSADISVLNTMLAREGLTQESSKDEIKLTLK